MGNNNVAIGCSAGEENTVASGTVAIGESAQATSGNAIAIGKNAVVSGTSGIAIGCNMSAGTGETHVANIFGATVGASGVPVYVDESGMLGTNITNVLVKDNYSNYCGDFITVRGANNVKVINEVLSL